MNANYSMLKNLLSIIVLVVLLMSCEKSYKYVEVYRDEGVLGGNEVKEKEPRIIKAKNDSTAYLEAYKIFCISLKVDEDMKKEYGVTYSIPLNFKLYNASDEDISEMAFLNKEKRKDEIKKEIFSRKSVLDTTPDKTVSENAEKSEEKTKVDSMKIKELQPFFRKRKDEFSTSGITWYEPKSAPQFTNRNGICLYFQTEDGIPGNLRFRMQYYADDWLFISKVQFSIDGNAFEYVPTSTETDNGDGGKIWEWFDESITDSDKELINALANAKSAKMKLIGKQYYDIKIISQEQIKAIKRTIEFYNALGGGFSQNVNQ
ncbi:hypothetical protein [Emticicia fluvialis]|uniref:hypothetical protein n=1 Tax=Emticicia fluvialis TaxID=2974474 RepID=UPI002166A2ED|nr:hypothetical protein [Emticicia fluvialis]